MDAKDACKLIEQICLKPGWSVSAVCNERYENTIKVTINYPAHLSNRPQAPEYRVAIEGGLVVDRNIMVGSITDPLELWRKLILWMTAIDLHEWREFFRVGPTWEAPFHPHTEAGIMAWGDELGDLIFGAAG